MLDFGNAVAIDGAEVCMSINIDGAEIGVFYDTGGGDFFIFDVATPPSFNEFKAVVDAGEKAILVKEGGKFYVPASYQYYVYSGEGMDSDVLLTILLDNTTQRRIVFTSATADFDNPLTPGVVESSQQAANLSVTYYPTVQKGSVTANVIRNNERYQVDNNNGTEEFLRHIWTNQANISKTIKGAIFEDYEVCVADAPGSGNVVQIGSLKKGDTTFGIYQFYYRTDALPNGSATSTATKIYPFSNLLADYTIESFIDATGVTSEGIFISNGRTDNNNRLIVQQFSKNNKTITIRAYQNFSLYTALLKVIFMGTKN